MCGNRDQSVDKTFRRLVAPQSTLNDMSHRNVSEASSGFEKRFGKRVPGFDAIKSWYPLPKAFLKT
jgi:hypothetical protein